MLSIHKIDTTSKTHVRRFIDIPFQFYKNTPQWVPPIRMDVETTLNRKKHPFYHHSTADFFIAVRDGADIGRLAVLENKNYNNYHGVKKAQFYFFECEDDQATAEALFESAFDWAKARDLDTMFGPKGFAVLDGYGVLVEGFEHRQMMTMMNYNHAYIPKLLENMEFVKEVDFVSCYIAAKDFTLPERIHRIADRVQERGTLRVKRFKSKKELIEWAPRIGQAYNSAFVNNWEYAPLTAAEVQYVVDTIVSIADYRLIKIIVHGEDVVGFLFGFADVSAALQRCKGRLFPLGIIDILIEMRRTKWISLNGEGILEEFQGRGGNALLYSEMENTVKDFHFEHADLTQVAETAVQMRNDLVNLGGKMYKNHRIYTRKI